MAAARWRARCLAAGALSGAVGAIWLYINGFSSVNLR
jgi:hypothetical protein